MLDRDLRLNDRVKTRGGELGRVTEVRDNAVTDCKVIVQRDDGRTISVGYRGQRYGYSQSHCDIVEIIPDAITPVIPLESRPWGDKWRAVRVGSPKDTEHYWSPSGKVNRATSDFMEYEIRVILEPVTPPLPKTHPGPPHLKGWWICDYGIHDHLVLSANEPKPIVSNEEPSWGNGSAFRTMPKVIALSRLVQTISNLKTLPDFGDLPPEQRKIKIGDESEGSEK